MASSLSAGSAKIDVCRDEKGNAKKNTRAKKRRRSFAGVFPRRRVRRNGNLAILARGVGDQESLRIYRSEMKDKMQK